MAPPMCVYVNPIIWNGKGTVTIEDKTKNYRINLRDSFFESFLSILEHILKNIT